MVFALQALCVEAEKKWLPMLVVFGYEAVCVEVSAELTKWAQYTNQ